MQYRYGYSRGTRDLVYVSIVYKHDLLSTICVILAKSITPPHQLRVTLLRNFEVLSGVFCSGVAPIVSGDGLHIDPRWAFSSSDVAVAI